MTEESLLFSPSQICPLIVSCGVFFYFFLALFLACKLLGILTRAGDMKNAPSTHYKVTERAPNHRNYVKADNETVHDPGAFWILSNQANFASLKNLHQMMITLVNIFILTITSFEMLLLQCKLVCK